MTPADTALLAIEQRVQAQLISDVDTLNAAIAAVLAAAVNEGTAISGTEIMSRADVHAVLIAEIAAAQASVEDTVTSGYSAAALVAALVVAEELRQLGHDAAPSAPPPGLYLPAVVGAVVGAFSALVPDVQRQVSDGYDGVSGAGATDARVLATNAGLRRATRRLQARLRASGAVAVHRGFTDAQLDLYEDYRGVNPYIGLRKRWQTNGADPCPECRALHGTVISVSDSFDPYATEREGLPPPVYRDLLGPPRHPNCRCRIALETTKESR